MCFSHLLARLVIKIQQSNWLCLQVWSESRKGGDPAVYWIVMRAWNKTKQSKEQVSIFLEFRTVTCVQAFFCHLLLFCVCFLLFFSSRIQIKLAPFKSFFSSVHLLPLICPTFKTALSIPIYAPGNILCSADAIFVLLSSMFMMTLISAE